MLTCIFEDGGKASFRHVVTHAIVEKSDQILLIKRAGNYLESGRWALPGGFLDRDETATECVLRELKEETGVVGEVVELFRINTNPQRPKEDRQNVALEFIVRPLSGIGEGDDETSKIEWISFDQLLPEKELAFDHGETIELYEKYREKKFPLPLIC